MSITSNLNLIALAFAGVWGPNPSGGLACGEISSPNGAFSAAYAMSDDPGSIAVIVCDDRAACRRVFSGSTTERVAIGWMANGQIVIDSAGGNISNGDPTDVPSEPWPIIRAGALPERHSGGAAASLAFDQGNCRWAPPIIDMRLP